MEDLVSIIVPVYNLEKYIGRCIASVINQTYLKIEIIIIDDGSTDKTGEICEKYARERDNIKLIHKKNEGVSKARNIGIEFAKGEYITFLDGDDYLENDAIENMLKITKKENSDITICNVRDINENGQVLGQKPILKENFLMTKVEALEELMNEIYFNSVCWAKIYKKELFNNIKFNEKTTIGEDLEVLYKIFYKCNKIVYTSKIGYVWLDRNDSVTKQEYNEEWKKEIKINKEIIDFINEKKLGIQSSAIKRYVELNIKCMYKVLKTTKNKKDIQELKQNISQYKNCYLWNRKVNIKDRMKVILLLYFDRILVLKYKNK